MYNNKIKVITSFYTCQCSIVWGSEVTLWNLTLIWYTLLYNRPNTRLYYTIGWIRYDWHLTPCLSAHCVMHRHYWSFNSLLKKVWAHCAPIRLKKWRVQFFLLFLNWNPAPPKIVFSWKICNWIYPMPH